MQNLILGIFISCTSLFSCIAQTYPMEGDDNPAWIEDGMSFKDENNNLNKFAGTWVYQDSINKLTIVLHKIENFKSGSVLTDVVVGNYVYEENGRLEKKPCYENN